MMMTGGLTGLHGTSSFVGDSRSSLGSLVGVGLLVVRCSLLCYLIGDIFASMVR